VGKTGAHLAFAIADSVHPHACGENDFVSIGARAMERFTPTRVGKTLEIRHARGRSKRFTPTRVGKTSTENSRHVAERFTPTRVGKTLIPC